MKTKLSAISNPIRKLNQLRQAFNRPCVLAGGALREYYMDMAWCISDYDIFIKDDTGMPTDADTVTKILSNVFLNQVNTNGIDINIIAQIFDSEYLTLEEQHEKCADVKPGSHEHINSVWEIDTVDDETYQLIFLKQEDPITYVEKHFDLGFCKIWCDGHRIHYTSDFMDDVNNKTLTLVGKDLTKNQVKYSLSHHAQKIKMKYPDFRIVVPEHYQQFIEEGESYPTR